MIIGGGISGLSLAIKLSNLIKDSTILLITKEKIEECNTFHAQGGIACVWDTENDDFKKHIQDTLIAGDGLCNEDIVRQVVTEAPDRIKELIEWGVEFSRDEEGKYELGREGGHSERGCSMWTISRGNTSS